MVSLVVDQIRRRFQKIFLRRAAFGIDAMATGAATLVKRFAGGDRFLRRSDGVFQLRGFGVTFAGPRVAHAKRHEHTQAQGPQNFQTHAGDSPGTILSADGDERGSRRRTRRRHEGIFTSRADPAGFAYGSPWAADLCHLPDATSPAR